MKRFFCIVLCLFLLTGCAGEKAVQEDIFCMDTVMSLKIWGDQGAMDACRAELYALQADWSATLENSVVSRLNQNQTVALTGQQQTFLDQVEALSQRTGGSFDPRLGALCEAWGFYGQNYRVPSQDEIAFAVSREQWDLGAAVKGWAGDRLVEILEQHGVQRALLTLGGNVQTFGEKADGSPWQIGIQNPDGGSYAGIVSVSGTCAVVTSGDYQRQFTQGNTTYHHILDPITGYPADSGLSSVTIICQNGLTADALSTALFVMGLEEAGAFWRESADFEAVFILKDGSIYATEGVNLSGCEFEVIRR